MIRFPIVEKNTKKIRPNLTTKYILSDPVGLDGAELIPIDLGGRLIVPQVSINELGKQLLKAAAEGDVAELKTLLTKGAPFTADWLGTSPLHYAAQNNHLEVCEILLRAGTSKDARTKVDRTPLHMAAYEGHFDIVDILLKHGADINCKDLLGMTPLHWAVQNGHLQVVKLLIQNGADLVHLNKFKLSPLDIAIQTNRTDIIEALNNDPNNVVYNFGEEETNGSESVSSPPLPVEAVLLEDYDSSQQTTDTPMNFVDEDTNDLDTLPQSDMNENSFSDSAMKILQEHGITMLPNEENNILSTVMESGHSVVLTDVGKEVLDSVKQSEQKKIITISADDFLAMTSNSPKSNLLKQVKVIPTKTVKRIVVNKSGNKEKLKPSNDMELVMTQLIEARQTIEMYKAKLLKKEQEAERYKQQLRLLMESN